MNRRNFLALAAASACATFAGPYSAWAGTAWTSGNLSPDAAVSARAGTLFAKLITERTNGEIEVRHFNNAQLGTTQEEMENTATGVQQLFVSSGSAASSLIKPFGIVDTAFLFRDRAHFEAFMASDMASSLKQRMADEFGVRIISSNWFALPRYLLHRDKFIETAADVDDVRVRAPNLPMFLGSYTAMGATPISIAYNEQYFALRQGLVDMTESAADRILPMKLHEVAPKITVCDMMYPQNNVYVNEASWLALTPELQDIVLSCADEAAAWHTETAISEFDAAKTKVEAEGGEFFQMPEETRAALADRIIAAEAKFVEQGLVPKGWFEKIRAL